MRHLKLGTKFLLVGLVVLAVPLIIIGLVAVYEADHYITDLARRDLSHTADGLAGDLNTSMKEQVITVKDISYSNSVIAAGEKVAKDGVPAARPQILAVEEELAKMRGAAGDRVESIALVDDSGVVFASSDGSYDGTDLSGADYLDAALKGTATVGSVGVSPLTGKTIISAASPIYDESGKRVTGAVVMGLDRENVFASLRDVKVGTTGYVYVVDSRGLYIAHPVADEILKTNVTDIVGMESVATLVDQGQGGIAEYRINGVTKLSDVAPVPAAGWSVVATIPTKELYAPATTIRNVIIVIGLLSLVVAAVVLIIFSGTLSRPMTRLVGVAEKIAGGDLDVDVASSGRGDEIGALARAFTAMVGSLREKARFAKQISDGDLTVAEMSLSERDELGNAFSAMVDVLRRQVQEIVEGVNVLASSGSEIMASVSQLTSSVAQTSTAVSETTATAEEVKHTTDVSAQKAQDVSGLGKRSLEITETGQRSIEDTIRGMDRIKEQVAAISDMVVRLSEQSQAIGEIIATVNDLAEQSNLLAVNAAIEAAKAGEQGKGFGVVAQEIRSLASQSKQATTQVRGILFEIQKAIGSAVMATEQGSKAVEEGVTLSRRAGEAIDILAGSVAEATDAAVQIVASSQQQFLGMDQVVSAMANIQEAMLQMSAGTQQTEKTVHDLQTVSARLQQIVEFYRV